MSNLIPTREGFGDAIVELGKKNENIYVVECDISKSTKTNKFAKEIPDRFLNVGIAEQNAAGVAAGLATIDKIPFVSTYAVFGSMRMLEQVRTSICYPNLNVKIACSHGGLTPGNDGVTHQAIEDMGIYRTIPNMTVIMPADYNATKKLVEKAVELYGPVYLRFTRDKVPVIYDEDKEFEIGKGVEIRKGKDLSIVAVGDLVIEALKAAEELEKRGISAQVIDMHTIKPLDIDLIKSCIKNTGKIITVEDHSWNNALGSAVSEIIAEEGKGKIRRVGLKDTFAESGPYHELLTKYGLDSSYIVKMAFELI